MTIKEMAEKYRLTKDDFWQLKRGGRPIWIVTHDACEKIALAEGIRILSPTWLSKGEGEERMWALEVRGYIGQRPHDDEMLWTTGEASLKTCNDGAYLVAMAEKRAKDRLILKLVSAYQHGIYSEVEADSFKRPHNNGGQHSPPK